MNSIWFATAFEKTSVKKDNKHPFYHALAQASVRYPTWNLHKYFIGRDDKLISTFSSDTQPDNAKFVEQIKTELGLFSHSNIGIFQVGIPLQLV